MKKTAVVAALMACAASAPLAAKEGMFTPGQLPEIAEDLRKTGLGHLIARARVEGGAPRTAASESRLRRT